MGFLGWLFGRHGNAPPSPDRPRVVGGLQEDSPFVMLDDGSGQITVMDREAFDHRYGQSNAPDPAQRDLDRLLATVTRVRVLAGGMLRGQALAAAALVDTTDAEAVPGLGPCLQICEDPRSFSHCECPGGPTLELYAGEQHAATLGLHHGHTIRWNQWRHDAELLDGFQLKAWLTGHGVEPELLDLIFEGQLGAASSLSRERACPLTRAEQRLRLAEIHRALGNPQKALAYCQGALQLDPELAEAFAVRGLIQHSCDDFVEAVADCTQAIERGAGQAEVYFTRAVAHDALGQAESALADCEMTLQIDPNHANAYNSRALFRERLGMAQEAIADYTTAICLGPDNFLPYWNRGQLQHARGQYDAAITDYTQALSLMGKGGSAATSSAAARNAALTPAVILCRRAIARIESGDGTTAEADFAEALRRDPATTFKARGQLHLRQTRFDQAVADLSEVTRLRSKDVEARLARGSAYAGLGQLPQAIADFTEVLRLDPDTAAAYGLRGEAYFREGRLADALADLNEVIRRQPADFRGYFLRGTIHGKKRTYPLQLHDLQEAQRLAPDDPAVASRFAWFLATCPQALFRDGSQAMALATKACEKTAWQEPEYLDTLAAACAECGRYREACRYANQALAKVKQAARQAEYRKRLKCYRSRRPYREAGEA